MALNHTYHDTIISNDVSLDVSLRDVSEFPIWHADLAGIVQA